MSAIPPMRIFALASLLPAQVETMFNSRYVKTMFQNVIASSEGVDLPEYKVPQLQWVDVPGKGSVPCPLQTPPEIVARWRKSYPLQLDRASDDALDLLAKLLELDPRFASRNCRGANLTLAFTTLYSPSPIHKRHLNLDLLNS